MWQRGLLECFLVFVALCPLLLRYDVQVRVVDTVPMHTGKAPRCGPSLSFFGAPFSPHDAEDLADDGAKETKRRHTPHTLCFLCLVQELHTNGGTLVARASISLERYAVDAHRDCGLARIRWSARCLDSEEKVSTLIAARNGVALPFSQQTRTNSGYMEALK